MVGVGVKVGEGVSVGVDVCVTVAVGNGVSVGVSVAVSESGVLVGIGKLRGAAQADIKNSKTQKDESLCNLCIMNKLPFRVRNKNKNCQ